MKKLFASLLVLSMLLVGCGKNEKQDMENAFKSFMIILKSQNIETADGIASFFKDNGVLGDVNLSKEMFKEGAESVTPKTENAMKSQISNMLSSIDYTVEDSKLNDDKKSGTITVTFKYQDISTAMKTYLTEAMKYVFNSVNATQTDAQMDAALEKMLNNAFANVEYTEKKINVDMVKEDKWLIKEANADLANIFSSGLYQTIKNQK